MIKLRGSMEYGDVPKWLKGPDSKSGRRVLPVQEFESLHLRHQKGTKKMYPAKSPILSGFFAAQTPFFKVSNS